MIGRGGNCATLKLPRSVWLAQDTLNVESEANGMFSVLDENGSDTDERWYPLGETHMEKVREDQPGSLKHCCKLSRAWPFWRVGHPVAYW